MRSAPGNGSPRAAGEPLHDPVLDEAVREAARLLWEAAREGGARAVVAFTGSGISAESGIPVFRGNEGLWEGFRAADLAARAACDPAVRGAADLVGAAAGSAVARTVRDLALRAADRAATAAIEAVVRELLRDALKVALRDTVRGIIVEVSRDIVVDVAKTTWVTATRPAGTARTAADGAGESGAGRAPAGGRNEAAGEGDAVWAQVTDPVPGHLAGEVTGRRDVLDGEGPRGPQPPTNGK